MTDKAEKVVLDMSVEPLVRASFAAAVAEDPEKSWDALMKMEGKVQECLTLAAAVSAICLHDIDPEPDAEYLGQLASEFVASETWAQFNVIDVHAFLLGLANQVRTDTVNQEVVLRLVFVLGAWFLSSFDWNHREWFEQLDHILNQIEAEVEAQ